MSKLVLQFNQWPGSEVLKECKIGYKPFLVKECVKIEEVNNVLDKLSSVDDLIDVSCTENEEEYNGNPIYREKVDVKLSSFIECFLFNEKGEVHWLENSGLKLYLSQCCIFSKESDDEVEIPSLADAFSVPPMLGPDKVTKINLWMNNKLSTSTLHYDAYNNLLCVYKGSKEVILISPSHSQLLEPLAASVQSPNHSSLSTASILRLLDSQISTDFYRQTVSAGDCIFIPEGWWHLVISQPCTVAVNFWFDSSFQQILKNAPHMKSYFLRSTYHELIEEVTSGTQTTPDILKDTIIDSNDEFTAFKRQKVCDVSSLYRSDLTQETFNTFMQRLYEESKLPTAQLSGSSNCSSSSSSSSCSDRECRCLTLVSTDIGYMIKFWLPYSTQVITSLIHQLEMAKSIASLVPYRVDSSLLVLRPAGHPHPHSVLGLTVSLPACDY